MRIAVAVTAVFTAAAAALWALVIWAALDERTREACLGGAVSFLLVAALACMPWVLRAVLGRAVEQAVGDRVVRRLAEGLVASRRAVLAQTVPLKVVR